MSRNNPNGWNPIEGEWTREEQQAYRAWIFTPDDDDPNSEDVEALRQERAFHAGFTAALHEQSSVTRDDLFHLWLLHGASVESDSREGYELADAILTEFTLTRKYEPAEVDPWVDPEPWVYLVSKTRAAHPLPYTQYRYAPRTHPEYNTEQEGMK